MSNVLTELEKSIRLEELRACRDNRKFVDLMCNDQIQERLSNVTSRPAARHILMRMRVFNFDKSLVKEYLSWNDHWLTPQIEMYQEMEREIRYY